MSPEEISRFESELRVSETLNTDFEKVRASLTKLNPDTTESNSHPYFTNLIPRMRERMDHEKSGSFSILKYVAPVVVVVLLYFLIPFNGTSDFEEQIYRLNDTVQTELLNFIDEPVELTADTEIFDSALGDELNLDEVNQIDAGYVNTNDLLDNLSNEEINDIYNSMISKKIL